MAKLFIIEDNESLAEALQGYLEVEGHEVTRFDRLQGADTAVRMTSPDLLILDVMLPDGDGFLFARRLRKAHHVPILFLTARSSESDRITGLELGADDYVVKPFSMRELVLRVRKILSRTTPEAAPADVLKSWSLEENGLLHILTFDDKAHTCTQNGTQISLTAAEWKIIRYLAEHEGMVISREQVLGTCLGYLAEGSERSVNTHIKNIRAKLHTAHWIETVRGFGYRFTGRTSSS